MSKLQDELREFRRLWMFVTVVTVLLVAATVTLNVMHAPGGVVAHSIGGSAPIFMFFCIEFIARIPGTSPWLTAGRVGASIVVAGIAFSISWQQQVNFMSSVGYAGWTVYAYPVMLDGVLIVAVLSLVEVTRKVRSVRSMLADLTDDPAPVTRPLNPQEVAAERAGRKYREDLARARSDANGGVLIRKPFELTQVAEAA